MARRHILHLISHSHETKIRKSLESCQFQCVGRSSPLHKNNTTLLLRSDLPEESSKYQSNQVQEHSRRWVLHWFQVRLHQGEISGSFWSVWDCLRFWGIKGKMGKREWIIQNGGLIHWTLKDTQRLGIRNHAFLPLFLIQRDHRWAW